MCFSIDVTGHKEPVLEYLRGLFNVYKQPQFEAVKEFLIQEISGMDDRYGVRVESHGHRDDAGYSQVLVNVTQVYNLVVKESK